MKNTNFMTPDKQQLHIEVANHHQLPPLIIPAPFTPSPTAPKTPSAPRRKRYLYEKKNINEFSYEQTFCSICSSPVFWYTNAQQKERALPCCDALSVHNLNFNNP